MEIALTCKLNDIACQNFLIPISEVSNIDQVNVVRYALGIDVLKVEYHEVGSPKGFGHYKRFKKMLKLSQNGNSDILIGIYEIPHGLIACLAGLRAKKPFIVSIIGNPAYKSLRKGIRNKISYWMYKKAAALTVTGSKSRQFMIETGIDEKKVFVLPNSIDINEFQVNQNIKKEYDIISIGRISPEKELGILLDVVKLLKNKHKSIKVGIAGKGPDFKLLQDRIISEGLEDNIDLIGYVEDIVEFYNSGKLFMVTSRTEGLPRTILEAMACGLPCVSSNVGDVSDAVINDKTGYCIENYKDIQAYADKIDYLLDNKHREFYEKLSMQARKHMISKFSHEAAKKVWDNIFNNIGVLEND